MKINNISTERADGIKWNTEELELSVWDGFYVMFEVENKKGEYFDLQYIAANSSSAGRDYENPTDHEKLEEEHSDFLDNIDDIADEISKLILSMEVSVRKMEESKEKLEEIMDVG